MWSTVVVFLLSMGEVLGSIKSTINIGEKETPHYSLKGPSMPWNLSS